MSISKNKRVIITGASSGIGAALAQEFAQRGAHLGLLARRGDELHRLCDELKAAFPKQDFCYEAVDVRNEGGVEAAVHALIERLGGLNVLIANSGIGERRSALSRRQWEIARNTFSVNLLGAIHTLEIAKDYFVAQRQEGQLVGMSSVAAVRGFPATAAYCASKAALSTYLEAIRGELAEARIEVCCLYPGYVRTPLTAQNKRMIWLMEVDEAARRIADAIESKKRRYIFPLPMRFVYAMLKHLPDRVYDRYSARLGSADPHRQR